MKDCIVINEKAYDRNSIEFLNWLWNRAQIKDRFFDKNNYKWTLGVEITNNIKPDQSIIIQREGPITLFGIEIEVDYAYPEKIQLWKNVTNEL